MSAQAIGTEQPIYAGLFAPLFEVWITRIMPAPAKQAKYLQLIQRAGEPQYLRETLNKREATPLVDLARCFSLTPHPSPFHKGLTLGDQLVQEIRRLSQNPNEQIAEDAIAEDKEKLFRFVTTMETYLNSYRDTFWFKFCSIIARIFPCLFTHGSPEARLRDHLDSIARIRTFVEIHYGPCPTALIPAPAPPS